MTKRKLQLFVFLLCLMGVTQAMAQGHSIGYYESDIIVDKIPEYEGIQQQLDLLSSQWREEITRLENEIEGLEEDYEAKEILYTEEIRNQKREEINQKKREKEQYIAEKFGPEGEYFTRQRELLEPIQRQVFAAVRAVAQREGLDFVFDRSGEVNLVYANIEYNLNNLILEQLGIEVEEQ